MSTDNLKQDLGFGCFPLIAILTIALAGFFIYPILTSSPVDYFKLFSTTVIFAVIFFVLCPWFRPIIRGFPPTKFILVVIFAFIVIYPMLMHPPVDYFRLFIIVMLSISFLFSLSPWFKPILQRFPQIGIMSAPIIMTINGLIAIGYALTHPPIDYFGLFWGVLFYLFFLFYFIRQARMLKTLPHRSATSSHEDQADQDQASASPPEKPILHFYLFGAKLKVFRYKFGRYSTYEITG
jgi:hypothetical protein